MLGSKNVWIGIFAEIIMSGSIDDLQAWDYGSTNAGDQAASMTLALSLLFT